MPRPELLATRAQLHARFGTRVFTTADAEACAISRTRLRNATAAGLVTQVQRGHFVLSQDPLARARTQQHRLRAQGVRAVLGERSAAGFWGVWEYGPRGRLDPPALTLLVPPGCTLRMGTRSGLRLKTVDLQPHDVIEVAGVAITTPLRAGFDIARALGSTRTAALVPLSSAARTEITRRLLHPWYPAGLVSVLEPSGADAGLPSPGAPSSHDITEMARRQDLRDALADELRRMCEREGGHGVSRVRRVLSDIEPLAESWLELVAWSELLTAPIPRPQPQAWVQGASGKWLRSDFLIGDKVILEVDGAGKYAAQSPWQEKQRQADLEAAGYWVVRCTWEELLHHPERVIARILLALERSTA